jgi:hypothetical protein
MNDFNCEHPHPGTDPVARLRHVLDLYPNRPDDDFVFEATYNQYSAGETTGLTFGDLRAIARQIGA